MLLCEQKDGVTVKNASSVNTIIRSLKSKKTYYFRIRSYKTVKSGSVSATSYYSVWSAVKKSTVK